MDAENKTIPKELLTVQEAAKMCGVSCQIIRNLIKSGQLKAMRLGKIKILKSTLMSFLSDAEGYDLSNPDCIKPFRFSEND